MRRIPYTLLVCLVFLMSTAFLVPAWASPVEDSADKVLAQSQAAPQDVTGNPKTKAITKVKRPATFPPCCDYPCFRPEITKVKPGYMRQYSSEARYTGGILAPNVGRWEVSAGVLFARLRGKIAWPRYPSNGAFIAGQTNATDFTDGLQLPAHLAVPTWGIKSRIPPQLGRTVLGSGVRGKWWRPVIQYDYIRSLAAILRSGPERPEQVSA